MVYERSRSNASMVRKAIACEVSPLKLEMDVTDSLYTLNDL